MLEAAVARRVCTGESAGLSGGAATEWRAEERGQRKGVAVDVCVFVPIREGEESRVQCAGVRLRLSTISRKVVQL